LAVVCLFFILYTWHIRRTINDINALTAGYNVQVSEQVEENADLQAAIDTEDQEILRERALAYAREHQGKSASGDEVFIDRSLAE
jgi:cell division protein FtsB